MYRSLAVELRTTDYRLNDDTLRKWFKEPYVIGHGLVNPTAKKCDDNELLEFMYAWIQSGESFINLLQII